MVNVLELEENFQLSQNPSAGRIYRKKPVQVLKPPQPKANLMLIDTSAKNAIEGLIGVFVVLVTLD